MILLVHFYITFKFLKMHFNKLKFVIELRILFVWYKKVETVEKTLILTNAG